MLEFGSRLKGLRVSKGLTQDQLALRLGVTKSIISAYESGTRYPSLEMLVKLSKSFNVSSDYLLGLNKKQEIDVSTLTREQLSIINTLIAQFVHA